MTAPARQRVPLPATMRLPACGATSGWRPAARGVRDWAGRALPAGAARCADRRRAYRRAPGKPDLLGNPDLPHTYSQLPDVAAGLATLGTDARAVGEVWHLPGPQTVSSREILRLIAGEVGHPVGVRSLPRPAMRTLGLVSPMMAASGLPGPRSLPPSPRPLPGTGTGPARPDGTGAIRRGIFGNYRGEPALGRICQAFSPPRAVADVPGRQEAPGNAGRFPLPAGRFARAAG